MSNITRWSPDTCGCVIEYEWDPDAPVTSRTHTIKNVVKTCPEHAIFSIDKFNHYAVVLAENQLKNKVMNQISKKAPDLSRLKFSFDSERNIVVEAIGMSDSDKTILQALFDSKNGPGKVKLI